MWIDGGANERSLKSTARAQRKYVNEHPLEQDFVFDFKLHRTVPYRFPVCPGLCPEEETVQKWIEEGRLLVRLSDEASKFLFLLE